MTAQNSVPQSELIKDEEISIPWDIASMYDDEEDKTIMNILNVNIDQEI